MIEQGATYQPLHRTDQTVTVIDNTDSQRVTLRLGSTSRVLNIRRDRMHASPYNRMGTLRRDGYLLIEPHAQWGIRLIWNDHEPVDLCLPCLPHARNALAAWRGSDIPPDASELLHRRKPIWPWTVIPGE